MPTLYALHWQCKRVNFFIHKNWLGLSRFAPIPTLTVFDSDFQKQIQLISTFDAFCDQLGHQAHSLLHKSAQQARLGGLISNSRNIFAVNLNDIRFENDQTLQR